MDLLAEERGLHPPRRPGMARPRDRRSAPTNSSRSFRAPLMPPPRLWRSRDGCARSPGRKGPRFASAYGLHTGEPARSPDGYVGLDVHRAARIANAGHGGQIVVSATTEAAIRAAPPADARLSALGHVQLRGLRRSGRAVPAECTGPAVDVSGTPDRVRCATGVNAELTTPRPTILVPPPHVPAPSPLLRRLVAIVSDDEGRPLDRCPDRSRCAPAMHTHGLDADVGPPPGRGFELPRDQAFRGSDVRGHRRGLRLVGVAVHAAARPRLATFLEDEIDRWRGPRPFRPSSDGSHVRRAVAPGRATRPTLGRTPRRPAFPSSMQALDRAVTRSAPVAGTRQPPPDLCDGPRAGLEESRGGVENGLRIFHRRLGVAPLLVGPRSAGHAPASKGRPTPTPPLRCPRPGSTRR